MIGIHDTLSDLLGRAQVADDTTRAVLLAEAHALVGAADRRQTLTEGEAGLLRLELERMIEVRS